MPGRVPRRSELAASIVGRIKTGARGKADLLLVDVGEGPIVVKDFAAKPWWSRALGRLQVARECRAYRRLGSIPGIARFLGRVDALALALERVVGEQLAFSELRLSDGEARVAELRAIVARMHDAGVYHQDLRGRENVLIRPDGTLVLVDLAGAFCFRPRGWLHRSLGPVLAVSDESALLKWKALLAPGSFTADEEAFLRRFRFWRSLWVFNRKRKPRSQDPS